MPALGKVRARALQLLLVLLAAFVAAGAAYAQSPIKIGAVTALSAPGAVETGVALLNGMEIAVEEINQAGGVLGRPIELVVGDTAGTPEKGTAVMERLITRDGVVAVAGELHSSVALAEIEVAHRHGIPIIIAEAWADEITAMQYPEVFRITVANSLAFSVASDWIKQVGFKKVAVIAENSDWGQGLTKIFEGNLRPAGIEVISFSAERTVTDFTPQLLRLRSMNPRPDLIINGFTGTGELLMVKQACQMGLAPTRQTAIFGAGMDVIYPGFWETVGSCGLHVLANPAGLSGIPETDVSRRFAELFRARYGREPDAVAMEGYDSIWLIAEAIRQGNSTDPQSILQALERLEWTGTRGTITFSTSRQPAWAYHQWMEVPIFVLQYTALNQQPTEAAILWPRRYATVEPLILWP